MLMGRREFLSLNALQFNTQSRKDDLVSMLYTLIILKTGYKLIDDDKVDHSMAQLCTYLDVPEFIPAANEIEKLEFEEKPDYNKIRFLFSKVLLDADKVPCEQNYDWSTSRTNE